MSRGYGTSHSQLRITALEKCAARSFSALSAHYGSFSPWLNCQNPASVHQCYRGGKKVGLKLNIQKTKIMASGLITSWQIDGETVADFILRGSKITTDDDCSHEIKRSLLLERKIMTNLDSIFESRDITLPTKVKTMVFPVVMSMDVRVGL